MKTSLRWLPTSARRLRDEAVHVVSQKVEFRYPLLRRQVTGCVVADADSQSSRSAKLALFPSHSPRTSVFVRRSESEMTSMSAVPAGPAANDA